MVMTLRERVPSVTPKFDSEPESESESPLKRTKTQKNPKSTKRRETFSSSESDFDSDSDSEKENDVSMEYEKIREQRIRENRERMERLGIFALSTQFNNSKKGVKRKTGPQKKKRYPPLYPMVRDRSYDNNRRSSRLKDVETERSLKDMGISIPDGWKTEVYTEEDEKLLGNCETEWTLKVDGLDEDGDRVFNPNGTPCHQCRQRVAGKLSYCGKCRAPQGQLCGDCLYTRYGENVLEAVKNPTWSCPACRGICNCSRCRRTKGWEPVNVLHSKVIEAGYKSVAHYLILTRRAGATKKELDEGAVIVDLTAEEFTAAPLQNEGSDYEWSESESDDSDSDDDSEGERNRKQQSVDNEVGSAVGYSEAVGAAEGSNEAVGATGSVQVL